MDARYLKHLAEEMHESIRRSEAAEERYRARIERHIAEGNAAGRDRTSSEVRASSDPTVRSAVADGAFYRDRAKTYAAAILAERTLHEMEAAWPSMT